jgi:Leucine-rich repeat (LRR) protein
MKHKLSVLLVLSLLICTYSCKKNDNGPINPPPPASDIVTAENNRLSAAVTNQTTTAFISGTVMDENGKTLPGVSVTSGNATATTNNKGYFQFPESVTVNKDYAIITATLTGYFKGIRTFTPNTSGKANHYFEIKLLKPGPDKTVSSNGGNIVLDDKIDLTFPNAAVVTSAGAAYTGQYKVVARYIDPAAVNFPEIMPGLLSGLNDQNQLQALQSFGMAMVELKDASGNPLQIAPGKTVTMKLPVPATGPATIPLWHFNEKYGMWIKAGVATKTGGTYTAEVNHFSTWNLDLEFNSFRLDLQFRDQLGNALSGLHAEIYLDGVNKIKSFYTDNEGKATLINCPSSKPLLIKAIFQCDTASKNLDPVTASRSEIIILPLAAGLKSYTITGKLSGCNNTSLGNQPFKIAIQGDASILGVPGVTDAQGNFTVTGMICNNSNAITVQAMTFISNEYRYAPAASVTLTSSIYNAQICDTAASVADDFQILFPDPALNSLIRAKINKPAGAILYGDVKNIDTIASFAVISDLSGIQFCTKLKILDLRGGANFSDLGLLKNLLSLQKLFISETGNGLITDISPLQNLTQLQDLGLTCPNLSDISPIQNLVHLQSLSIVSNNLSNISALSNLTQINWLQLISDALGDLNPLQNLTQLKNLQINSKLLTSSNLDVLKNFKSLIDLTIRGTSISDFSVVKDIPRLLYIHLDGNQISDVSQFASLTNLVSLELSQNKITDISSLQTMTQLQYLKLSLNQISDISSLKNMSAAIIIDLEHNKISDVTPLQNLNNLQILWLNNNQVSNINPLINGVPNLQVLRMSYQQQGTITQTRQDAFKNSHPACYVEW